MVASSNPNRSYRDVLVLSQSPVGASRVAVTEDAESKSTPTALGLMLTSPEQTKLLVQLVLTRNSGRVALAVLQGRNRLPSVRYKKCRYG